MNFNYALSYMHLFSDSSTSSNISTTTIPSNISSSPPTTSPQLLQNQVLDVTTERGKDSINVQSFRHLGGVGECRHNFHCIGSEACVNFKGNFM